MNRPNSVRPPASNKPANSGQGLGSSVSPSSWNIDSPGGEKRVASASPSSRRAGQAERLRPFIDESKANELFYPAKADRPWRYIVLHHSAAGRGNYDQIDREHRKILGYDGCGYHFVIGNGTGSGDGQIEVAQRWNNQKQGVHCRNAQSPDVDEYGIGICLVGDFDQQPPTPRQVAAAQALLAYLGQRYRIEANRVSTHAHLAATPTVCPGKFFPSESILVAAMANSASRDLRTTLDLPRRTSRPY
jgi:N-acetyl-anhydromuramyl-L-alanine amidase AmpD